MTELSPQAQAVLDAVASQMEGGWISPDFIPYEAKKIAAALRVAADQVVPKDIYPSGDWTDKDEVRYQLLATADELEALPE